MKFSFFILLTFPIFLLQCSADKDENLTSNCEVKSSSLKIDGVGWSPCGGSFGTSQFPGGSTILNFTMNDATTNTGTSHMLVCNIYSYNGVGVYTTSLSNAVVGWQEFSDLNLVRVYFAQSGSLEIVEQDDKQIKVKINSILTDSINDVSIVGEFELRN
ncbi:MAG: hypothetical protein H6577_19815 [Lewinellaceae bacterium]|nr:hypothetical protein [Saprospiraceae bacterium]MCB9340376.1 hypothetical protein [Lewinellaceae bacterium]